MKNKKEKKTEIDFPFYQAFIVFFIPFFLIFNTFELRFILYKNHKFVNGFIHVLEIKIPFFKTVNVFFTLYYLVRTVANYNLYI
jgi:hypothetical protein